MPDWTIEPPPQQTQSWTIEPPPAANPEWKIEPPAASAGEPSHLMENIKTGLSAIGERLTTPRPPYPEPPEGASKGELIGAIGKQVGRNIGNIPAQIINLPREAGEASQAWSQGERTAENAGAVAQGAMLGGVKLGRTVGGVRPSALETTAKPAEAAQVAPAAEAPAWTIEPPPQSLSGAAAAPARPLGTAPLPPTYPEAVAAVRERIAPTPTQSRLPQARDLVTEVVDDLNPVARMERGANAERFHQFRFPATRSSDNDGRPALLFRPPALELCPARLGERTVDAGEMVLKVTNCVPGCRQRRFGCAVKLGRDGTERGLPATVVQMQPHRGEATLDAGQLAAVVESGVEINDGFHRIRCTLGKANQIRKRNEIERHRTPLARQHFPHGLGPVPRFAHFHT